VRLLFDTNVLIAGTVPSHPDHAKCLIWLKDIQNGTHEGFIAAHTLAEYHRYMTTVPKPKLSPQKAEGVLKALLGYFAMVCLDSNDTLAVFARMTKEGLTGGVIWDVHIAQAGLRIGVDHILTMNTRDFYRLGKDITALVLVP
jgi:predicted nucleic acid-binding protein